MTEICGNSVDHLNFFIDKLQNSKSFALIRPGDGEYFILIGKKFNTQDNWRFNGGSLTNDLHHSLKTALHIDNLYIGISCPQCPGDSINKWFNENFDLPKTRLTYANIVCNHNWKLFMKYLIDSKKSFYYIGPGQVETTDLNIISRYFVDEYLVEKWDSEKEIFINNITNWITEIISNNNNNSSSLLFIFSAGPISKILVVKLFQMYPEHTFMDCGSALDYYVKGHSNRLYIKDSDIYSHLICDFKTGHSFAQ